MSNDIKFKSLEELYKRVRPALHSKAKELHKNGYNYIHEEDIWNFLKDFKWVSSRDLDLGCIVNDIFSVNNYELNEYVKETIKKYHRNINQGEI